jgi:hypothetical protein
MIQDPIVDISNMKIYDLDEVKVEDKDQSICMILWIDDGVVFDRDCDQYNEGKLMQIDMTISNIFKNITNIDLEDYGVDIINY